MRTKLESRKRKGAKKSVGLASLKHLKKKAWKALSLHVRRSAADKWGMVACYTCGHSHRWKAVHAGHAIPGRHGSVLFDLDIIRPQCPRCNIFLRGNYPVFTARLIGLNGLEWWEKKWADSHRIVKWSRSDLEALIAKYA